MRDKLIVTVDGPAGSGKSTVSKILAKRISYAYLDTGALYRALAYKVLQSGVASEDGEMLTKLCNNVVITLESADGDMKVFVDNQDVTDKIRTEEIGTVASDISALSVVRQSLLSVQRQAGRGGGIIAEGRDMATVVFPDADIKFYLDADASERGRRRYLELLERGMDVELDDITVSLLQRDRQDSQREIAPLRPDEKSVIIDTTFLTIDNVVEKMVELVRYFIKNTE